MGGQICPALNQACIQNNCKWWTNGNCAVVETENNVHELLGEVIDLHNKLKDLK